MRVFLAGLMLAIALFLGYAATRGARLHAANTVAAEKHRTYSTRFPSAENPVSEGGNGINGETAGMDWANVRTTLAPSGLVLRRLREAPSNRHTSLCPILFHRRSP